MTNTDIHRRSNSNPGPNLRWYMRVIPSLARSRRALQTLDKAQLADIGLSAAEAETEAKRPVWDVPTTWRRS